VRIYDDHIVTFEGSLWASLESISLFLQILSTHNVNPDKPARSKYFSFQEHKGSSKSWQRLFEADLTPVVKEHSQIW